MAVKHAYADHEGISWAEQNLESRRWRSRLLRVGKHSWLKRIQVPPVVAKVMLVSLVTVYVGLSVYKASEG
jgi:hypothetical protein